MDENDDNGNDLPVPMNAQNLGQLDESDDGENDPFKSKKKIGAKKQAKLEEKAARREMNEVY